MTRYYAFELCISDLQGWADSKYNGTIPSELGGLHQLSLGLAFVHKQNYVHRDICPRNILISVGGDRFVISDFGLCKKAHDSGGYSASQHYGHEKWLAPERIAKKFDPNYRVTLHSDTWAMGCVFYFFLTKGSHPYDEEDLMVMLKRIKEGTFNLESKSFFYTSSCMYSCDVEWFLYRNIR